MLFHALPKLLRLLCFPKPALLKGNASHPGLPIIHKDAGEETGQNAERADTEDVDIHNMARSVKNCRRQTQTVRRQILRHIVLSLCA